VVTSGPEVASNKQVIAQVTQDPSQFSGPIVVGDFGHSPAPTSYNVYDTDFHGSTPAPSRTFLKNFKAGIVTSTIAPTLSQSGISLDNEKILTITQRPIVHSSNVHPGVVFKSVTKNCDHPEEIQIQQQPTLVEVQKSVNIKNILIEDQPKIKYEFGQRIVPQEYHHQTHHIVEKPVYIDHIVEKKVPVEKVVTQVVEKNIDRPVYIDRPVSTFQFNLLLLS
jgi:hypothetical protein